MLPGGQGQRTDADKGTRSPRLSNFPPQTRSRIRTPAVVLAGPEPDPPPCRGIAQLPVPAGRDKHQGTETNTKVRERG